MTDRFKYAVLFDLDGTLIDSVADLAAAVNRVLVEHSLESITVDQVRTMIGNGMKRLVERAFAARDVQLDATGLIQQTNAVMRSYETDLHSNTVVLPGAFESMQLFSDPDIAIAIVTNKPQRASEQILAHFEFNAHVDLIVGGDLELATKPAPDMLLHALNSFGVAPERAMMVGDSPADVGAANRAGVTSVVVRGGYTAEDVSVDALGADFVLDSLLHLQKDMLHRHKSSDASA